MDKFGKVIINLGQNILRGILTLRWLSHPWKKPESCTWNSSHKKSYITREGVQKVEEKRFKKNILKDMRNIQKLPED